MDIKMTLDAIGLLIDAFSSTDNQAERLKIFTTIKVLCDILEATAHNNETWQGYMNEKFSKLLYSCASIAGLTESHESWITHLAYAGTELSNLKSQSCFNVE